jgi:polyphosphate kinase
MANDGNAQLARINGEMRDTLDEELEMEIDDDRLAKLLTEMAEHPQTETLDRHVYFKELLRLQGELVKLQDWVVHQKLKVVVLFEGRDSAGKGGVIKRITQRLNPRICRVAALPAPNERERTQCISSATWRIFRPAEKSSCSTAAGTTAPASSG